MKQNFLLIIMILFLFTSADELECKFTFDVLYRYGCVVQNNGIFKGFQPEIDGIEGIHLSNNTNDEVENLFIKKIRNVTFIPRYIDKFFINLERIEITHSNLKAIFKDDFKPFPKLKYLFLNDNELKVIEENLFEFNENLEIISLKNNKILHIDPFVFSNLRKLSVLNLSDNFCEIENGHAFEKDEIKILIEKVENKICYSLENETMHEFEETANKRFVFSAALTEEELKRSLRRFEILLATFVIITVLLLISTVSVAKYFILNQGLEAENE